MTSFAINLADTAFPVMMGLFRKEKPVSILSWFYLQLSSVQTLLGQRLKLHFPNDHNHILYIRGYHYIIPKFCTSRSFTYERDYKHECNVAGI